MLVSFLGFRSAHQCPRSPVSLSQENIRTAMSRTPVNSTRAPAPAGPYSHAIVAGDLVFASGQTGTKDPATGQSHDTVEAQAKQALANLSVVLEDAGTSFANVVKTTIFLTDIGDFAAVNAVYGEVMGDAPPARSTVQVAALPGGAIVEIEMTALRGS